MLAALALSEAMRHGTYIATALLSLMLAPSVLCADGVKVSHLYNLSNFSGTIPYNHVGLFVDRQRDEVYVADGSTIRIFNGSGMEVYRFVIAPAHINVNGLVVDEDGDILALSSDPGPAPTLVRWNYRGEPKARLGISGIPPEFASIAPGALATRNGHLFLASTTQLLIVEADRSGAFVKGYDLGQMLDIPESDRPATQMEGFSIDREGNLLLTIPVLFQAFVISPDGKVAAFGKAGSAPGRFGVVSGIAADGRGNYLVGDKLRSVVMVFGPGFKFLTEFGYVGRGPENLVRPGELAAGETDKLYVTQLMNRGVAVFSVASN